LRRFPLNRTHRPQTGPIPIISISTTMEYDENRPEPIPSPDTSNETRFNAQEVTEPKTSQRQKALLNNRNLRSRRQEYKLFEHMNRNLGLRPETTGNTDLKRAMDRKQRFDAIASRLEMTTYQRETGRSIRNSQALRNLGYSDECVAFCLCVFICRYGKYAHRTPEKDREVYHPDRPEDKNDRRFTDLAADLGLRENLIRQCMGRMAHKLPRNLSWY